MELTLPILPRVPIISSPRIWSIRDILASSRDAHLQPKALKSHNLQRQPLRLPNVKHQHAHISRRHAADPAALTQGAGLNPAELLRRFRSKLRDGGIVESFGNFDVLDLILPLDQRLLPADVARVPRFESELLSGQVADSKAG